ncbi:polypeptide N-acetylgalactosaminyltransferase 13-like [Mytilus californianus]|uniref:polypeptide N-acetylgalactosaminyltransferase 13-like n=1 Tax=Mytilus californianus TaxID=6549 RepID=UPI0022472197|nr:polypeptide N-acetylgalactosaminyltransferase 13-like [Mytilus californianus]
MFPTGLVKIIRNPTRQGLIKSRMNGWRNSTGEVIVFFDSHMEVNIDWLQPLLSVIKQDRRTIAMGNLDYIQADTFEYQFYRRDHIVRYVFDWSLYFWESRFRPDQYGPKAEDMRPGAVMVGPAMAVDSKYFREIGAYDEGMKIWGGENLELPWRVWMCGGKMVHMPCSHVGHIARPQPYSFPLGRRKTELYNYKRAVDVWMDPAYKKFVYDFFPEMKNMDAGDISERLTIKEKLKCKKFTWYLENVRPELLVYDKNVFAWGSAKNMLHDTCLDNNGYLLTYEEDVYSKRCTGQLSKQGFSWTRDKLLRTTLHCVALTKLAENTRPKLVCCMIGPKHTWDHKKNRYIKHEKSGLCLDQDEYGLIMRKCSIQRESQNWTFTHYNI